VNNSPLRLFLLLNAFALLLAAVWLRGHALSNIPGINGDEAWYGVEAWRITHGETSSWHTPTGNPVNPFWLGPLLLLHLWLPPSITLLRSMAVVWGLAALAINWILCRRVFDRSTAAISTLALAVLPINIAYSRFAWDASQSLAATLPVVYFALGAARFADRFGRWIAMSLLALVVACWVHPTNVFAGAAILVVCVYRVRSVNPGTTQQTPPRKLFRISGSSFDVLFIVALAAVLSAIWFCIAYGAQGQMPGRITQRLADWSLATLWQSFAGTVVLYPRLLIGGTVYHYIAGSRSWFEAWQFDIVLFWTGMMVAGWLLWRSCHLRPTVAGAAVQLPPQQQVCDCRLRLRSHPDGLLLAAWALQLFFFLLLAGPGAMSPGWERFSICMVGPTVIVLARGTALAWQAASARGRCALAVASLVGWLPLADFQVNYFQFIEQTGGQAHLTFRTAAAEPKLAAIEFIQEQAKKANLTAPLWIVCSEWWNRWPIRYLALPDHGVYVPEPDEFNGSDEYRRAQSEGRVWSVAFCQREGSRQSDPDTMRWEFADYSGRPVIEVRHEASR
jgi:hypothetical protein